MTVSGSTTEIEVVGVTTSRAPWNIFFEYGFGEYSYGFDTYSYGYFEHTWVDGEVQGG